MDEIYWIFIGISITGILLIYLYYETDIFKKK